LLQVLSDKIGTTLVSESPLQELSVVSQKQRMVKIYFRHHILTILKLSPCDAPRVKAISA